jgi:membrane protease YdiL (CAAX protease family)
MDHVNGDLVALIPFAFLLLSVLGLWIHRALWVAALIASVAAGYLTGALYGLAGVWMLILAGLALLYRSLRSRASTPSMKLAQAGAGIGLFGFALALALVLLPGFPRTVLIEATRLSPGAAPFSLGLGFPKVVTGILLLGILNEARVRSGAELLGVLRRIAPVFLATLVAVIAFALILGYVKFAPKWTALFLVWAPVNLFFTCLSEEAFFRGFLQHEMSRVGRPRIAVPVALILSAVLFGLAHFAGGWTYVAAGVIAGLGYGWAYHRTQRIEAAMAVHFGVNAVHLLVFTYPYAAST